jgi:hypothetical protein
MGDNFLRVLFATEINSLYHCKNHLTTGKQSTHSYFQPRSFQSSHAILISFYRVQSLRSKPYSDPFTHRIVNSQTRHLDHYLL